MVSKFLIVIGVVVTVMAALVLLPSLNSNNKPSANDQAQLNLEYDRAQLSRTRTNGSVLAATSAELLTIQSDGSATFRKLVGGPPVEKTFVVTSDDMGHLKGLIFDTGFMNIPITDYAQKQGLTNVTKYTLKVNSNSSTKTINWVNPDSYNGTIPPIIVNLGSTLDGIISKYT